jgi:hypothetical protein
MNFLASATQQGFPQGWFGLCIIIYFLVWVSGFILQTVINRRFKTMAKQGTEGLPETRILYQSIGTGMERYAYFLKGKYKATGDSRFIMLCEIYRILLLLIIVMLLGFAFYFIQLKH